MKKALFFLILVVALSAINSTCEHESDNCHYYIAIQNNSNKAIYVINSKGYPDSTYFKYGPNPVLSSHIYKVLPGETNTNNKGRECIEDLWEYLYESSGNKMMYYIFDAQTLETTPWDTVCKKYLVLKRYDLSLADLQRMNWTITYP